MNTYSKMYRSNAKAKKWLTENGFTDIFLKPHSRFSKDIYGLFDGFAFDSEGWLTFLQIKSNAWPPEEPIRKLICNKRVRALAINAKDRKPVEVRYYRN